MIHAERRLIIHAFFCLLALAAGCRAKIQGEPVAGTSATVTQQGNWDLESTPFPGEGYYDGLTSSLGPADICEGKSIFGAAGARVCLNGTSSAVAVNSEIQAGKDAWDAAGNKITGTYVPGPTLYSNAHRSPGTIVQMQMPIPTSSQLPQATEAATHAGAGGTPNLPTTGGYLYRDVPDDTRDDDGYTGKSTQYAPRPTVNCGAAGTIDARIADCVTQNPTRSTWNGAIQGSHGGSVWRLVRRAAANVEVWKDTRTGLIWSSRVGSTNWCAAAGSSAGSPVAVKMFARGIGPFATTPANGTITNIVGGTAQTTETFFIIFTSATTANVSGNCGAGGGWTGALTVTPGSTMTWNNALKCSFTLTQGTVNFASPDTIEMNSIAHASGCTPGAGIQSNPPVSYCAEPAGFNPAPGENWGAGTYMNQKGGMGANAADKVRWRLPTVEDYQQANVNGIRFVMPDMGASQYIRSIVDGSPGYSVEEWTATLSSNARASALTFRGDTGLGTTTTRNTALGVRCVGR